MTRQSSGLAPTTRTVTCARATNVPADCRTRTMASTFVFQNGLRGAAPRYPRFQVARSVSGSPINAGSPVSHVGDAPGGLYRAATGDGECRVICFSPDHGKTLATMDLAEIGVVIDLWKSQLAELLDRYEYVQIFETTRSDLGVVESAPARSDLGIELPARRDRRRTRRTAFRTGAQHGSHLLVDYVESELAAGDRIIHVKRPLGCGGPVLGLLAVRNHRAATPPCGIAARSDGGRGRGSCRLAQDNAVGLRPVVQYAVPVLLWLAHRAAGGSRTTGSCTRTTTLRCFVQPTWPKIPASYELLANLQRDLTPETAAGNLRAVL